MPSKNMTFVFKNMFFSFLHPISKLGVLGNEMTDTVDPSNIKAIRDVNSDNKTCLILFCSSIILVDEKVLEEG